MIESFDRLGLERLGRATSRALAARGARVVFCACSMSPISAPLRRRKERAR
jgi:NAD(P)-dependent dehydrogenase (short-subunit alcohol dehydrogenase family)